MPRSRRISWCLNCGVPLLQRVCGICGGLGVDVELTGLADPRPAFEGDLRRIDEGLRGSFDTDLRSLGLDGMPIVVNRLPYMDEAFEVIVGGVIVAHTFFDLYTLKWRLKPFRWLCRMLLEEGLLPAIKLYSKPKGKGFLEDLPASSSFSDGYIALVDRDGQPVGLAESIDRRIYVVKTWGGSECCESIVKRRSLDDILKANIEGVELARSRACRFTVKMGGRFGSSHLTVAYSGGKDSLATLSIVLEAGLDPQLVFNDTGLELPETIDNVRMIADRFSLDILEASAGDAFWSYLDVYGPPARDYRWCCKLCKLTPTSRLYRRMFREAVSFIGQRRFESRSRRRSKPVGRNRLLTNVIYCAPINDWSMMHVWLYLRRVKLDTCANPLYREGFDRIGCYLCPYCNVAEFREVERLHRDLWYRWLSYIDVWASKLGYDRVYVERHLWRWVGMPSKISSSFRIYPPIRIDVDSRVRCLKTRLCDGSVVKLSIPRGFDLYLMDASCYVYGIDFRSRGHIAVASTGSSRIYVNVERGEATIIARGDGLKYLLKPLVRSLFCARCGLCIDICPSGALTFSGRFVFESGLCSRCGLCVQVCPSLAVGFRVLSDRLEPVCNV
ncbi:MAG: phosphoadenosine phosphosulfate reductase family protein [Nitrososphaerota archaeon]|nr:phosphoadenosine phosphosulfate reductase family protein [Candidatus Bathyarchaeota archaeon]MDW8061175.1 phosphoadenosine phosphosulfate reductase family protein [Nitrososphaerota archaeon]